jgi:hypothetical protein
MYLIGYLTVALFMASLLCFVFAAFIPTFFVPGSVLGAIFFLISTIILGWMILKRRMTEFKN